MHRRRRHVGHLLGRLQLTAGCGAEAAGPEGDHDPLLDRRPLRRRRPLPRRLRARDRHAPLGFVDADLERAAARPAALRRRLAGGMARSPGAHAALHRGLARAPAAGRLLEARLRVRRLRGDRVPGLRRRRLRGRLHERGAAAPRRVSLSRARASSAPGRTRSRTTPSPAPASVSSRRPSAGGTTGSRAPTPA